MYICDACCAQDAVADTPFHVAAKRGHASVLRFFVENCTKAACSAIVRMVNHEGNTPLHAAAMNGHAEAAAVRSPLVKQSTLDFAALQMLFALDPTCSVVLNSLGKTPLQLARDNEHKARFLTSIPSCLSYIACPDLRRDDGKVTGLWSSKVAAT